MNDETTKPVENTENQNENTVNDNNVSDGVATEQEDKAVVSQEGENVEENGGQATDTANENSSEEGKTVELEVPADVIPHAMYKVTGLINITDGQGQIQGQYPLGSVHAFTVEQGNVYVDYGTAELVVDEDEAEAE